jgi:hypothetical protein
MLCDIPPSVLVHTPLLAVKTRVGKHLDTGHKMGDHRCICIVHAYHVFRTSAMVRLKVATDLTQHGSVQNDLLDPCVKYYQL